MSIVVKENVSLAPYTIYRIGGPARYFVEVKNPEELGEALNFTADERRPFFILGAGSNVLMSDRGFDGLVVHISGGESKVNGQRLVVDAGVMMAQAVLAAAKAGLTGFEWGIGVPGTIGGSVRGNAGCFGGEMSQVLERVQVLEFSISNFQFPNKSQIQNSKFETRELNQQECEFSYRGSIFKRHPEWIILSSTLKLQKGDPKEIQEKIKRITSERSEKQDIGTKSCGCIFKNISWARKGIVKEKLLERFPELTQFKDAPNIPASLLIDQAGLKGRQVGQVFISPKHANYFVNEGETTAEEVVILIGIAKDAVRRKYGILLEEEIQYVGFDRV